VDKFEITGTGMLKPRQAATGVGVGDALGEGEALGLGVATGEELALGLASGEGLASTAVALKGAKDRPPKNTPTATAQAAATFPTLFFKIPPDKDSSSLLILTFSR
jgi:hypothetical protein